MYLDDNPDYQTVWQLAHNWANANPDETDTKAISPKLRELIIRLILAIRNKKISARTRNGMVFENNLTSFIEDIPHYFKTRVCLSYGVFNKQYLDTLFVKREEVIELCMNSYYKPPDFWMPECLPDGQMLTKENKNRRPPDENEDRIRCQTIALTLWELDPAIHPAHLVKSKIMQLIGNGKQYDDDTIKVWIAEDDPQKNERKPGRPPKTQYKINLKMLPQSKK